MKLPNRFRITALLMLVCIVLVACGHTVRLGAIDKADERAFDILGTASFSLDQLKIECSPSPVGGGCSQAKKDAINKVGAAYNSARLGWMSYRQLRLAGKPANAQELTVLLDNLILAADEYRKLVKP